MGLRQRLGGHGPPVKVHTQAPGASRGNMGQDPVTPGSILAQQPRLHVTTERPSTLGPTSCYHEVSSIPPPLKGHREKGHNKADRW